jgi:hypothetical protein
MVGGIIGAVVIVLAALVLVFGMRRMRRAASLHRAQAMKHKGTVRFSPTRKTFFATAVVALIKY